MKILSVFTVIALLSSTGCSTEKQDLVSHSRPNIVFILADDLGYGDVGAYNPDGRIATPNLDQMAADGLRFTDAHSGGSTCVPSRYGLLTARFAARATLQVREGPAIKEDQATIASLLQANGYQTAIVGKWHQGFEMLPPKGRESRFDYSKPLRGGPVDRGFDSFFGMHASLDIPPFFYIRERDPVMPPTEITKASTSVGSKDGWNNIQGAFWREGPIALDFVHEEVTPVFEKEAVKVIESYASGSQQKPLFLYLALPSPHTPWLPSEPFRGKSKVGMYGDFVMQVDAVVGTVSDALREAGLTDNTLLIFSSDNGPVWYDENTTHFGHSAAGPLRGKKATRWEGAHREPFLMRWPDKIKAGSTNDQTISFVDVFATFGNLVGVKQLPTGAAEDSESFLSAMMGTQMEVRPPILHDAQSIRSGDWKLILPSKGNRGSSGELYNLREDLGEKINQYEADPELVEKLSNQLKSILAE